MAAGGGSRMMPLSMYMEKSMLYVEGKPVIRRIVDNIRVSFPEQPICIIVLDKFMKDFNHEFRDVKQVQLVSMPKPAGTAGTYAVTEAFWRPGDKEVVLLHYADSIVDLNYSGLYHEFIVSDCDCMLAVSKNVHHEYSAVMFDMSSKEKRVWDFAEKPKMSEYSWTGIAMFKHDAIISTIREFNDETSPIVLDFGKDVFPRMLSTNKKILAYTFDGAYVDAGNILAYWRLQREDKDKDKA